MFKKFFETSLFFSLLSIYACKPLNIKLPSKIDLSELDKKNQQFQSEIFTDYLQNGFLVSRKDGQIIHEGDSMLWTGVALGILPCEKSEPLLSAIENMIISEKGAILRIYPLPEKYQNDQSSLDMQVGAMFGLTLNAYRCKDNYKRIQKIWRKHIDYIYKNGFKVAHRGPDSKLRINPSLKYVIDVVSDFFEIKTEILSELTLQRTIANPLEGVKKVLSSGSLSSSPFTDLDNFGHYSLFEIGLMANAIPVVSKKMACYPIHLATLQLLLLSILQKGTQHQTHKIFCAEAAHVGLPLTDWFCHKLNKRDLVAILTSNETLDYEYRHQRCEWEQKDANHYETHQIDWLILYLFASGAVL